MAEDNIIVEESNEKKASKVEKTVKTVVDKIFEIPNKNWFQFLKGAVIGAGGAILVPKGYRFVCELLAGSDDPEDLTDVENTSEEESPEEELPF